MRCPFFHKLNNSVLLQTPFKYKGKKPMRMSREEKNLVPGERAGDDRLGKPVRIVLLKRFVLSKNLYFGLISDLYLVILKSGQ